MQSLCELSSDLALAVPPQETRPGLRSPHKGTASPALSALHNSSLFTQQAKGAADTHH